MAPPLNLVLLRISRPCDRVHLLGIYPLDWNFELFYTVRELRRECFIDLEKIQ